MNGLINSDGNYAVVTNTDKQRVDVVVYKDKAAYDNGISPFFDKTTPGNFYCGEPLNEAYNETAASGTESVADNVIIVAEAVVAELALTDANKFRIAQHVPGQETPIYIKGDWTVWVA